MRLIEQIDLRYGQIGVRASWLRCGEACRVFGHAVRGAD